MADPQTTPQTPAEIQPNLGELTVAQLQDLAREREIPGRSGMNREQLVGALLAPPAAPADLDDDADQGDEQDDDINAPIEAAPAPREASGPFRRATRDTPITADATGRPR